MKKIIQLITVAGMTSMPLLAQATNGDQMLGVSATQWGMGGAVVAEPQDATTVLTNPAALADLGFEEVRFDMGFGFLNPPRKVNGTESDSDLYLMPAGATAFRVNERLTFGMGMAGLSGMGVDVKFVPGNNPQVVTTKQFYKIAPGFGYRVNERLSLGAAFNLDYQSLAMAMYNPAIGLDRQLPQNQVYGYGATFGLTYQMSPKVRLGASYETKQNMDAFEWNASDGRYEMTMDAPPKLALGIAYKPNADLLVEMDIKHIWFSDVLDQINLTTPSGSVPLNFGWDDQTVIAIGVQKQVNPKTALRFGYNYGKSPIGSEDVTNNFGSLAVTEHHLTLGMTRNFSKRVMGSFSYAHAFNNEVSQETGMGVQTIELEQNIFNFQISYQL